MLLDDTLHDRHTLRVTEVPICVGRRQPERRWSGPSRSLNSLEATEGFFDDFRLGDTQTCLCALVRAGAAYDTGADDKNIEGLHQNAIPPTKGSVFWKSSLDSAVTHARPVITGCTRPFGVPVI